MKIQGNTIRVGNVLELRGKLWVVIKTQHTQPGKGGAYMQVEMKNVLDGTKINERFRSSESVERAFLEEIPHQYLYAEGDRYVFMEPKTYEQIQLSKDFVGDAGLFLQDNMDVQICFWEGKPISLKLPDTVVMTITDCEAYVKGQTATSSYKPATLENGMKVMVPPYLEPDTKIIINTEDCTYVERAKSA